MTRRKLRRSLWFGSLLVLSGGWVAGCGGESSGVSNPPAAGDAGEPGSGGTTGGSGGRGGSSGSNATGGSSAGEGGTGGTGGSTGGTGGGTTGGTDAGGSGGTGGKGGMAGAPPDIPLNEECEDFMPCGGEPEGSWIIVDTCFEIASDAFVEAPGCEEIVEGVGALVEGRRTYTNGEVTLEQTVTARILISINDACASGLLQQDGVTAQALCPLVPALVSEAGAFTNVTCDVVETDCRCDVFYEPQTTTTTTTYEVVGTQIVQGDGATYDFCVNSDTLGAYGESQAGMDGLESLVVQFERE